MKQALYFLARLGGVASGHVFSLLPAKGKTAVARALLVFTRLPSRVANLFFEYSFWCVKRMGADGVPIHGCRRYSDGFVMDLNVAQKTQRSLAYLSHYEEPVTSFFRKALSPGDVFIDVGANVGYYTLLAASHVGREGRVISFEPEEENMLLLKENVRINAYSTVTAQQVALSDTPGELLLYLNPFNEGGHSLKAFEHYHDSGEVWSSLTVRRKFPGKKLEKRVPVTTLDRYLSQNKLEGKVGYIKIDVEHLELQVLSGMAGELTRNKKLMIVCEVNFSPDEIRAFLGRYGFMPYQLLSGGNIRPLESQERLPAGNCLFACEIPQHLRALVKPL